MLVIRVELQVQTWTSSCLDPLDLPCWLQLHLWTLGLLTGLIRSCQRSMNLNIAYAVSTNEFSQSDPTSIFIGQRLLIFVCTCVAYKTFICISYACMKFSMSCLYATLSFPLLAESYWWVLYWTKRVYDSFVICILALTQGLICWFWICCCYSCSSSFELNFYPP